MRVLYISRNYPNRANGLIGLWVEGLVRAVARSAEVRVIAPVPYCPPVPSTVGFAWYRSVPRRDVFNGVDLRCPRFLAGPGMSLHQWEGSTFAWAAGREAARLHAEFPFDIIHAHFVYPDGVAAVRLGRQWNTPVVITDHAPWTPWMNRYSLVRRRAISAFAGCAAHISVGHKVKETVLSFTGPSDKSRVLHVGFDPAVFALPPEGLARKQNQIVYVGRFHRSKGSDVLLQAMRTLVDRRPDVRLVMVGGSLGFANYRAHEEETRALARTLGLEDHVEFVGMKSPPEVARYMQESTLLVLPSRRESFGAVLVEALGCGTPVVATRCGGPEDIVRDDVGELVPTEDPAALAAAMERVLDQRARFRPAALREYSVARFSWDNIAREHISLYSDVIAAPAPAPRS